MEQFGIRTLGLANVLLQLSGIICTVWPIHALEVKFGITSLKLVFVWETKYSLTIHACHLNSFASMELSGTLFQWPADVLQDIGTMDQPAY